MFYIEPCVSSRICVSSKKKAALCVSSRIYQRKSVRIRPQPGYGTFSPIEVIYPS